ncbi:uncharacterized protein [Dermacentor albipictus]|uniref:uncharacterized protein n=1 Tax=Dermacentor albipictus TaxID=60249 RepID=UPI0031FCBA69
MHKFREDVKDTILQLVKSLECPICLEILRDPLSTSCHHRFCRLCLEKALQDKYKIPCPLCKTVVTKRSLTQSDLIVKLVDKVKQLVCAVKNDAGVEVTSPKGQLESADTSLEQPSVLSSVQKAVTSCKSSLTFGSRPTTKRAFVVHTDADIVGAVSKKPRSTSTTVHDKLGASKDIESHGSNSSKKPNESLQNGKDNGHARTKLIHAAHAKLSSVASASITADNVSLTSTCSVRQECHSNFSEAPMDAEMQLCNLGTGRNLEESGENQSEKVQDWLKKCDSIPQKNPPSGQERSEAQESCNVPTEKQLGSNRFFTMANQESSVSAKRNSVLDVSDTDPYKFIPSQKSVQAAQRGKRRRLRGSGRAAGLTAKRSSRRKSDHQKSVCEFENLRDLFAEGEAQEKDDAQELEIELFVTPGVRPCVEKKVVNQRRSHTTARKRPRKIKSNLQLKPLEEQAEELQRKISEAESHELVIVKALPENVEGRHTEKIRNTNALKDVSNLKAQVENKVQNVTASSVRMSPSEEENLLQQPPPEVDEPITCQAGKTSTILHFKTRVEPTKEKDIVDLCSDDEGNRVEASEKCKDSAPEGIPGEVRPDESCIHNDTHRNAATSGGSSADVLCSLGGKGTKQSDSAPDEQCQKDNQSEEQSSGRPLSLKDFEGMFKKSSRKTFDLNASTQDLESLGSGAVDTLELMTEVCNSLKQVPASEPDIAPVYDEPQSTVIHTNCDANPQVNVPQVRDTMLPHENNKVDGYSCSSNSAHMSKNDRHSSSSSISCPASIVTPVVEPGAKDGSEDLCHVTNTESACPACNAHLSLVCVDGIIKVILKGQPQKPALVEVGMCTERPFTKVIICREAMTQTESSDIKELDPGSFGDSSSSLPSPHLPSIAPDAMQTQTAVIENGATGKVLHNTKDRSVSNTSIQCNNSSASAAFSGLEEEPVMLGFVQHTTPAVEVAVLKTSKESVDSHHANKQIQGTEILCENTEDQAVLTSRSNLFQASQFGLKTIVEDTEEMDTTPSIESKNIDKLPSSSRPLLSEDNPPKCDWDENRENQSQLQCSAEKSLLKSQNEAFLRREGAKLPELGRKCSGSGLPSCHPKRVLPQYKQSIGCSSKHDGMETGNNDINSCSGEECFPSYKRMHQSIQEERHDPEALPTENTCHQPAPTMHSSGVASGPVPEAKFDQDLSSSVTPSFATAYDESDLQKASSLRAHGACSPENVVASGGLEVVAPNQDDGHTSEESSPWSSPILIRRAAPRSVRNNARKALVSSDTTSREETPDSCEIIEASSKADSGRKSSRQVPSMAVESDSDSDPVTESEAEELLRRAVQEDNSEEAAVIFAKRAVAPLEVGKKPRVPVQQMLKRSSLSPERHHNIGRPTQQSGTPSQGKYHSHWKKHDSSMNDGDSSENTGGRSMATPMSSTLSEGLDRTLKEKLLEQDIEEMKKQMMMLENELQKTTVGKRITDSYSHKDSSANNVVAMNGKDDNWDWDDSDGADEAMELVPPTPPRKSRSSNDESCYSTTK